MRSHLLQAVFLTLFACLLMGACPQKVDADGDGHFSDVDCDDADPFTHPDVASDFCDAKDNDCDGTIDEDTTPVTVFADQDGDGYGDPNITATACAFQGSGYSTTGDDCDDLDGTIHPDASDANCDQIDNDCDGDVDEDIDFLLPEYEDADGDGYGFGPALTDACGPRGVTQSGDCDDMDGTVNPAATEVCNGIDDDCDADIDEGLTFRDFWGDIDGDGYGDPGDYWFSSCAPLSFFESPIAPNDDDCDDTDAAISPDGVEVCNFEDDDCDGATDEGFTTITAAVDTDGDGYGAAGATPLAFCALPTGFSTVMTDCDDGNAQIHPGVAADLCDTIDNDCDTQIDEDQPPQQRWLDNDGDGYGTGTPLLTCSGGPPWASSDGDCDDGDATVWPGAPEVCDGDDEDCDGVADNGFTQVTATPDNDGDGYGAATATPFVFCSLPPGFSAQISDCNDTDPAINPAATEVCDSRDNNCDGQINEGLPYVDVYRDLDGDGFGDPTYLLWSTCSVLTTSPYVFDNTDCNDADAAVNPAATDICGNGVDDDCNGQIDDGAISASLWYVDSDGDGYGDPNTLPTSSCTAVTGRVLDNTDCDDADAATNPGETADLCDLADNDCDGSVDEDQPSQMRWLDTDGDGYGVTGAGILTCTLTGPPWVASDGDCDDTNASAWPGAPEACNGVDDDCDGVVDNGVLTISATPDNDGDGYGSTTATVFVFCAVPAGFSAQMTDCDDFASNVHPGMPSDICDGVDNDCDTQVDEDATFLTWYPDADADGYGDQAHPGVSSCSTIAGITQPWVTNGDDCFDGDSTINPGVAFDSCNFVDNDCDGQTDEDEPPTAYNPDDDGDGYGADNVVLFSCNAPSIPGGDCADWDPAVNPGAQEVCSNGLDDDCDNQVDEGCSGGGGTTQVCGPINTDTTWTGDIEVTCPVDVVGGATLTMSNVNIIEFHPNTELTVGFYGPGSLQAVGTLANPILMTSTSLNPAPGDWGGLIVGPQSGPSTVTYVDIEHGGGLNPCFFAVDLTWPLTLDNLNVSNCGGTSGMVLGNSDIIVGAASSTNNQGEGVLIDGQANVISATNLVLTGNAGRPGTVPLHMLEVLEPPFVLTGNGDDRLELLGETVDSAMLWPDLGLPYLLMTDVIVESTVPGQSVLTIEEGVIVLGGQQTVTITSGVGGWGTIVADGTNAPILFGSGQLSPSPGDWQGLTFGTMDEGSTLNGVTVSHGGSNGQGNVTVESGDVTFQDGSSEFSAGYGIYRVNGAQPTISPQWGYVNNVLGDLF